MSPWAFDAESGLARFPRVSGDEPRAGYSLRHTSRFSPRERG